MRVLILGGTQEARELKQALGDDAILALARTTRFGGAEGLRRYIEAERITHVVDATHPFATRISANAALSGANLIRLERPAYDPQPGWTYVDHLHEAPLPDDARVFLTTGHHELHQLATHPAFFLIRALTPPPPPLPQRHTLVLAKGPFALKNELELIDEHELTHLVTKDSGGPDAKLRAAAARNLQVTLIKRPPRPCHVPTVNSLEALLFRLSE